MRRVQPGAHTRVGSDPLDNRGGQSKAVIYARMVQKLDLTEIIGGEHIRMEAKRKAVQSLKSIVSREPKEAFSLRLN